MTRLLSSTAIALCTKPMPPPDGKSVAHERLFGDDQDFMTQLELGK